MYDKHFEAEIDGHTFTGFCDYEAPEPATDIDPAYPAIVTVTRLFLNGSALECYDIISPATIHRIEAYLVEQFA
jgi:hypothetical protein